MQNCQPGVKMPSQTAYIMMNWEAAITKLLRTHVRVLVVHALPNCFATLPQEAQVHFPIVSTSLYAYKIHL